MTTILDLLVSELGQRRIAVELPAVREVLRLGPITPVPGTPPAIVGAMNAGGRILPVLDVARLLGEKLEQPERGGPAVVVADSGDEAVLCVGRPLHVVRLEVSESATRQGLLRPLQGADGPIAALDLPAVFASLAAEAARLGRTYQVTSPAKRMHR